MLWHALAMFGSHDPGMIQASSKHDWNTFFDSFNVCFAMWTHIFKKNNSNNKFHNHKHHNSKNGYPTAHTPRAGVQGGLAQGARIFSALRYQRARKGPGRRSRPKRQKIQIRNLFFHAEGFQICSLRFDLFHIGGCLDAAFVCMSTIMF